MGFRPDTILLVDFGKYSRNRDGTPGENIRSVAQLPFVYQDGLHEMLILSDSRKAERRYGIEIPEESERYIQEVLRSVIKFPRLLKCQGAHGDCEERAAELSIPYSIDQTFGEKVRRGWPEFVRQTNLYDSRFLCESCAETFRADKGLHVYRMPIGLSVSREITTDVKDRKTNFNRHDFHNRIRQVASRIPETKPGVLVDARFSRERSAPVNIYNAQTIVTRLLGLPDGLIPEKNSDFVRARVLSYGVEDRVEQTELFPENL
jgi:hypothetical protein